MPKIYFFDDKICTLVNRKTGEESEFKLEAPNGRGIYEVDFDEVFPDSKYVDGDGILRSGYNEYDVTLTFQYANHFMDLFKLMDADEVIIPWSLDLKEYREDKFILFNEEMIQEFLHGMMVQFEEEGEFPHGNVDLIFRKVEPLKNISNEVWFDDGIMDIFICIESNGDYRCTWEAWE